LIEPDTKLRAARGLAKSETQAAIEAFSQLKGRGHPEAPPPVASDGWGGHREALVEVWGKVPPYRGRGRPPTKKRPQANWRYLQVVKQRERTGRRVCGVKARTVYGDELEVRELLGESTSCVERTHLTSRHMNGRLVRKTLGYSKELEMLGAACEWEDTVYNLARACKTLRVPSKETGRRWRKRTPAMAARLADHIWTIEELLTVLPLPMLNNT
jgi:hypothetical protein